jgi:hypothetical protein
MMLFCVFGYGCGGATAPSEVPVVVLPAPALQPAVPSASAAPSSAPDTDDARIAKELADADAAPVHGDGVPTSLLDIAAGSAAGVGAGGDARLHLGGGTGGALAPGNGSGGLGRVGGPPAPPAAVNAPIGTAMVGSPVMVKGTVSNAAAVIAGFRPGFRRCYNKGLLADPTMAGRIDITATIGPNGEVLAAKATKSSGLSATVIACVTARVSAAQFAPPDGGAATVLIPATFAAN